MSNAVALLKKIKIHKVVWGIGIFILLSQYVWKSLYVGGALPGVYWLFFYLDEWFLQSIAYTFILAAIILFLWILSQFWMKRISTSLMNIFGALIFMGLAIVITFSVVLAHSTVFIEKLRAENRVYYLSAYPMFAEVNYSVAECEFTGQICRTIFISGDITGTNWLNSHLKFDENSKKIMLDEDQEGVIFSKVLK